MEEKALNNRKIKIILLLVVFSLLFTSCSNLINIEELEIPTPYPTRNIQHYSEVLDKGPEIGGVLKIASTKHDSFNPLFNDNYYMKDIFGLIFEGLITLDGNYKPVPILSDSYELSDDGKVWTYKLKKNIKWHDGKDFTAEDVDFTIKTLLKFPDSYYHGCVKDIESYQVVDSYTIKISYAEPNSLAVSKMYFPIISKHMYETTINTESTEEVNNASDNVTPVGTGKYKFSSANSKKMLLKANEQWHGENIPYIRTVQVDFYNSTSDIFNSDADIIFSKGQDLSKGLGKIGYGVKSFINTEYRFLALNNNKNVFSEPTARKAVAMGINKDANIKSVMDETAVSSDLPIYPELWLSPTNTSYYSYDKNKAVSILETDGWTLGTNNKWHKSISGKRTALEFDCLVNENDTMNLELAEAFKSSLKSLNINMKIVKVSEENLMKKVSQGNYEAAMLGLNITSIGDLDKFYKTNNPTTNVVSYSNTSVDTLFVQLKEAKDEKEMRDIFTSIKQWLIFDTPFVGLYFYQDAFFYNTSVKGISEIKPNFENKLRNIEQWYIPGSSSPVSTTEGKATTGNPKPTSAASDI